MAALVVALLAGVALLFGAAGEAPASAAVRQGGGGVTLVAGCVETPGQAGSRCGVLLVVCGDDGTVASVALVGLGLSGHGGLVVRVGAPCPGYPASSPPPVTPPSTGPPTPSSPTPPPSTGPRPTSPTPLPPSSTAGAGPPPGVPGPPATGTQARPAPGSGATAPLPATVSATVSVTVDGPAGPPAVAAPADPGPPGTTAPGSAASASPDALFFAAAPDPRPPGDRPTDEATRWWLLSVLCVLLPAALAATFPRGGGRHS